MSDAVAIVSVVVTGIVAPAIAAITTRWQLRNAALTTRRQERQEILDDATEKLAQLQRASRHCVVLWSRGKTDDDTEVKDQLRIRHEAGERMVTTHGRICIRYGPDSTVATAYETAIDCMSHFTEALDAFRRGEDYSVWKDQLENTISDVRRSVSYFLRVASQVMAE